MTIALVFGLVVPFAGTVIGAAFVLVMRHALDGWFQKALLGFAAGVMVAASVWSLIVPSIDLAADQGVVAWVPAAVGFLLGMLLLLGIDELIPHIHPESGEVEGQPGALKKPTMMFLAIAIHNFPEGMAVGVVLAGYLSGETDIALAGVITLAVGIAIQNIPEGAIVSMPLKSSGLSRGRAFLYGVLSGAIEPAGALVMLAIISVAEPMLPYILSFAAGAMMYVVVEELVPATQSGKHTNIGTIGLALGFVLMMVLDVALG